MKLRSAQHMQKSRYMKLAALGAAVALWGAGAPAKEAAPQERPKDPVAQGLYGPLDQDPNSALYARPVKVAEGVWSAIGATQPPTYQNAGHNNNLSFVIGEKGVLVVNGGAASVLAAALHEEIKKLTDKPVLYVVAENGQGHAMLGMGYWKAQGARIIAQKEAAEVFAADGHEILDRMKRYNRDLAKGTSVAEVDQTFEEELVLDLGGLTARLMKFGPAHSPGDISVIIPERNVIIAGDMAFHVRLPPIFEDTNTAEWMESWKKFREIAREMIIVPGHGGVTDFATVDDGTRGYIEFLRGEVAKVLDAGGTLSDAEKIDQTRFKDRHTYWELAGRNAGRVFEQMEFE